MEISFVMLPVSWLASQSIAPKANIGAGSIFTLAMVVILLVPLVRGHMPPISYYSFCAIVEIIATVTIVRGAWSWKPAAAA